MDLFIERIPVRLLNNHQYTLIIWSYTNTKQINYNWNDGAYSMEWCKFSVDTCQNYDKLMLSQNVPNPFNSKTVIIYNLPSPVKISLKVFDLMGREITKLIDQEQSAGEHYIIWNGKNSSGNDVASGIYLYYMTLVNRLLSRKMLLIR